MVWDRNPVVSPNAKPYSNVKLPSMLSVVREMITQLRDSRQRRLLWPALDNQIKTIKREFAKRPPLVDSDIAQLKKSSEGLCDSIARIPNWHVALNNSEMQQKLAELKQQVDDMVAHYGA